MKNRTFILLLLVAVIFYLLLFPSSLKGEMTFVPVWNTPVSVDISADPSDSAHPFIIPDLDGYPVLGYISDDGELNYKERVYFRAAVSKQGFINYSPAGDILVLQDPSGMVIDRSETGGFPLLQDGWFIIISRDRKGISLMTWESELLWDYNFGSIITTLDPGDDGILMGFLNGDVIYMERDGRIVFKKEHRDKVIYSCSLSSMEGGFAIISGVSPQKLLLYTFVEDSLTLLWEKELEEEFRTSRKSGFTIDNKHFYLEESNGLVFYDLTGEMWGKTVLPGFFENGTLSGEGDLSWISSRNEEFHELRIEEFGGDFLMETEFPYDGRILVMTSSYLIASGNGQIFRIDREVF